MQYVLRGSEGRISGDAEGVENWQPVDETGNWDRRMESIRMNRRWEHETEG